ncbi:MAG: hypothetical protein ACR2G2_05910 [Pseudonocardia sp.]
MDAATRWSLVPSAAATRSIRAASTSGSPYNTRHGRQVGSTSSAGLADAAKNGPSPATSSNAARTPIPIVGTISVCLAAHHISSGCAE